MNKVILVTCVALNMLSVCYASVNDEGPETQPKIMSCLDSSVNPMLVRQNAVANLAPQGSLASTVLVDPYSQDAQHYAEEGTKENPIDVG